MGGDLVSKALFQPPDRIRTGDEVHSDLFDEPRVIRRVDPVTALDGSLIYWEARIVPLSQWNRENLHPPPRHAPQLSIFISHSSDDRELAQRLIQLLRSALRLPASSILCSSVDGHRLRGGAQTDQQLKQAIRDATVFIGVISPNSIESMYVLFELGARWGADEYMVPLLAPGTKASDLIGPLRAVNALAADEEAQVHQLLHELGAELGIPIERPDAYHQQLRALVTTPPAAIKPGPQRQPLPDEADASESERLRPSDRFRVLLKALTADAKSLLIAAADDRDGTAYVIASEQGLSISVGTREFVEPRGARSEARWKRAVEELGQAKLLEVDGVRRVVTDDGFRFADLLRQ